MPKYIITYLIGFFTLLSLTGLSQVKNYSVEHYNINSGLSQNSAECVFQDKLGLIWIGTQDGLNRFDGYDFNAHRQNPGIISSISNNYIKKIIGSKDTILWILTIDGLDKYNCKNDEFTSVIKNKHYNQSSYSINIQSVLEDDSGIIWLRTLDAIIKYNPEKEEFFQYKQKVIDSGNISDYNYFSLKSDSQKNLWTGSKNGLIKFDTKKNAFTQYKINNDKIDNEVFYICIENDTNFIVGTANAAYNFNPKSGTFKNLESSIEFSKVRVIFKDKSEIIWIGTEYGLMYILPDSNQIQKFPLEDYINEEVNIGNISDIIQDNSNILWVTTDYGVFKIDSKSKNFRLYRKEKNNKPNFSSNTVYSIFFDEETELLWLGTRGFGLNIFDRKSNSVKTFNKDNSPISDNNIQCIKKDKIGNIWIGTNNGSFIYEKNKDKFITFTNYVNTDFSGYFNNNRISDINFDGEIIWFSTFNGLLKYENREIISYKKTNNQSSIVENEVVKTIKDSKDNLWIATLSGLSKLNLKTGKFKNYTSNNQEISSNAVLTVYKSFNETIWLGTGTGLNKYIPEKDSFVFYTTQSHGFENDFIYTIAEDDRNNLWLSTNKGIIRFNTVTELASTFSIEDNLQGYEYNIGSMYASGTDEFFWGGINGVNSIKVSSIKENQYSPKPIITKFIKRSQIKEENLNVNRFNDIRLTHNESSFEIYFAVPEYTYPSKNKFKYRIIEADTNWIELGVKNSINFFQLSPGSYTIQILGSNSDNIWNPDPTSISIQIASPWWQTTGAYVFYILLLAFITGSGFLIYNREIRKENKILNEKQIVAKEVEKQKELLAIKNNNIAESMRYASGIINSLLPTNKYVSELLPDSFVLFMSKEIVSGDFYWVDETEDKIFAAAVDCTGHGVPGAFMSIIGLDLLRNILNQGIDTPAQILDELNKGIADVFQKDENKNDLKDGMDISMIAIHKNDDTIEFAGAINQIFIIRDDNIIEIKGDRFSVSPHNYHEFGSYTNHTVQVEDEDMIYLFSDGYADQFGGPDEKKFKYRRFRHMLLNNYDKPVGNQHNTLKRVINTWRGLLEQVDDILVMGIRIHTNKKN